MSELPPRDDEPIEVKPAGGEAEAALEPAPPPSEPSELPERPSVQDEDEREQRRREREERRGERPQTSPRGMVPARAHRRFAVERVFVRLVATGGIVAIAVVLGAILVSQDVAGWTTGLVIGLVTVVLAALLWSSQEL